VRTEQGGAEGPAGSARRTLVDIRDLELSIPTAHGSVRLLDRVSLGLDAGGAVGIVGESGSGKSLLGLTLLGLTPPGSRLAGSVRFEENDLLSLDQARWRALRGHRIAMVYQDALTSLNPGMRIGRQLSMLGVRDPSGLLDRVHLPSTRRILRSYPHQLSGGQRQRVLIAMALARSPALIVADEPTTALDVTVQAQVAGLLTEIRRQSDVAVMLISHDLALVAQLVDSLVVMYAGQVVETGTPAEVLGDPRHPYTIGLIRAQLSLEQSGRQAAAIPGVVPAPRNFPSGCRFRGRCPRELAGCAERPALLRWAASHSLACHNPASLETT
jgi:peptide/nickel transport system permease protein